MPVNYFEAKPQRAVSFNEVTKAIIPDNSSDELKTALTDAGVAYEEYAAEDEESRKAVLNKQTGVLFQYDIENGPNKKFAKALTSDEWEKYNYAMISGVNAGLRISENAMLVECEKGEYSYKLVIYDSTFEDNPIKAVYGIGNDSYSDMTIHEVARIISKLEEMGYDERGIIIDTLKRIGKVYGLVLGKYNEKSRKYTNYRRNGNKTGQNSANQSDRAGVFGSNKGTVKKEFQLTEDDTEYLALAKNPEKNKARPYISSARSTVSHQFRKELNIIRSQNGISSSRSGFYTRLRRDDIQRRKTPLMIYRLSADDIPSLRLG